MRVQRCSRCHKTGHNAMNKLCLAGIAGLGDAVADEEQAGVAVQLDVAGQGEVASLDDVGSQGDVVSQADLASQHDVAAIDRSDLEI